MNLIACADENWGIGFEGHLLVHIPEDMKFFRDMTLGSVVVMGRKTLESLPGGRPLEGRRNLVLTRNRSYQAEGVQTAPGVQALMQELSFCESRDIYVIGGANIYRQLLCFCDTAYITKVAHAYQADTFLPDLDIQEGWRLAASSKVQFSPDAGVEYRFLRYERVRAAI